MRQARQQQHHLLGCPPALAAGDQAQGLFVLAEGRLDRRPTIVGIGQGGRLTISQGRDQHRILLPAFLLGRPDHPLACGPAETVGMQHGGDLAARARRWLPWSEVLA